jgi:hypothetical protein
MKCLFIPSCEIKPINDLSGTITEKQLIQGLKIYSQGNYDKIIVSGGIYLPPKTQTIASGTLMKTWLIKHGVSEEVIISEIMSRDTYENISFSLNILGSSEKIKITVVAHWQHALRFFITFLLAHKRLVRLKPMWFFGGLKTFVLEWAFLLIHLFDIKGQGKLATLNRKKRTS